MENTSNIWTDLISEFHKQGHDVLVVAPAYDKNITGLKIEHGVKVLRVATFALFNVGSIKKGIANILLPHQYKKAIKDHGIAMDFDLIIMPTPPITLANIAEWIKRKSHSKIYLVLRDIFPQNAVDLEMIKPKGPIHWYFRKKEKKLYDMSDKIGCMSQANIDYIIKHNSEIDPTKLHLLPNWEQMHKHENSEDLENIKLKYNIANKFVALYGGNIGKPQKLENIVKLAAACSDIKDIAFLIIGKGTEYEKISNMVNSLNLSNVIIKPNIPRKEYNDLLCIADLGLISLNDNFSIPNFPSKVLSYFDSKKPVLASLDLATDFGNLLDETNSGFWAEAGKTTELKAKLMQLYNDRELATQMGLNGYNHKKKFLLPENAYSTIMDKMTEISS